MWFNVHLDFHPTSRDSSYLQQSFIVPVPKTRSPLYLKSMTTARWPWLTKCFERLLRNIICSSLPSSFDPFILPTELIGPERMPSQTTCIQPNSSGEGEGKLCENAVHWPSFSIQHNSIPPLSNKDEGPRTEHHIVPLKVWLSHQPFTGG